MTWPWLGPQLWSPPQPLDRPTPPGPSAISAHLLTYGEQPSSVVTLERRYGPRRLRDDDDDDDDDDDWIRDVHGNGNNWHPMGSMGFPWELEWQWLYHKNENGSGDKSMGIGTELRHFSFSMYHMRFCSVIRKLGKHSHFNFTLARTSPEHVIFTSLMCTVTD